MGTGTWLHSFMRACTLWSLGQPRAEHPFGAGSAMHCMLHCTARAIGRTGCFTRTVTGTRRGAVEALGQVEGLLQAVIEVEKLRLARRYFAFLL